MRKLLLAGVACVAAWSMSGAANAATVYESASTGYPGKAPVVTPKPGELVVNIDLRINTYVVGNWNTAQTGSGTAVGVNNVNGVGSKASPLGIAGYGRAYLGVSGKTISGINYGLFWEIRQNFTANTGSSSDLSSGVSGESGTGTLFWRRNYAYIGTDSLGTVRLGQTDSSDLYLVGVFDDFGTGGWNGDLTQNDLAPESGPVWPWMDVGNYYTSAKIVYLSPSIAGFDFGIGYEPAAATMTDGLFNQNLVSTSDLSTDLSRRRNTIDGAIRYKGAFGPVGVATSFIGIYGGHVLPGPINTGINGVRNFDNFQLKDVGLALTTYGLTFGGNYLWGQFNGQGATKPAGQPNAAAWIGGAEYAIGPLLVGAAYYVYRYAGTVGAVTTRQDNAVQVGANYNIAPGLQVIAEYLWGQTRQNAVTPSGSAPSTVPGSRFFELEQAVGVGLQLRW
jgi:predicted porin